MEEMAQYIKDATQLMKSHGSGRDISVKTELLYPDDYGNFATIHKYYCDASGAVEAEEITEITYDYLNFGNWQQTRLKYITQTKKRGTDPNDYIRKTEFVNDPAEGLLTQTISDYDKLKPVTTIFSNYDAFGNPWTITLSGTDSVSRITKLEYDPTGRFITKRTNPLEQVTEAQYDPKFGRITWQKDINGLVSINRYDGFGRVKETRSPTGITTTFVRNFEGDIFHPGYRLTTTSDNLLSVVKHFDELGRKVSEESAGFDGTIIFSSWEYNAKGQLFKYTQPHYDGETGVYTEYEYYDDGRLKTEGNINGSVDINYTYNGRNSTVSKDIPGSNPYTITMTKTIDALGNLIEVDDNGVTATYKYFASGQLKNITMVDVINGTGDITTSITYDEYGYQDLLIDPSSGTTDYDYNSLGELVRQESQSGTYTMNYDKLGRIITRTGSEGLTTYTYDTEANGKGLIASIIGYNGINKIYKYDTQSRINQVTEIIDGQPIKTCYTYDQYNRLVNTTYPSDFKIERTYNNNGYADEVHCVNNNSLIWKAIEMTSQDQLKTYKLGENLQTTKGYNIFGGYLTQIKTGNIQNLMYNFNLNTGNLDNRGDAKRGFWESFYYDEFNRLRLVDNIFPLSEDYSYMIDNKGNITDNTKLGELRYGEDGASPYAITSVDNVSNVIPATFQNITYTSFGKAETITEQPYEMQFTYSAERSRKKVQLFENGECVLTRYYSGSYEKEITLEGTRELNYIFAGDGLAAIYVFDNAGNHLYYILKDHLGSITGITDEAGNLLEEFSYDAWGNRRNPENWSTDNIILSNILTRGFTGHEHLDEFGLINMNGRMYDPVLGRFLSPDNYVNSSSSQGLNRYSYALNNPLKYTDPDGEWVHIVVGAAIGGIANLAMNWNNIDNFWEGLAVFGIGAGAGAATAATGNAGFWYAAAVATAGGAAVAATNNVVGQTNNSAGLSTVEWNQVGISAGVGGVSGFMGYAGGYVASNYIGGVVVQGMNVNSPVLKGVIGGGIGGAAGGYVGGATGTYIMTGNWSQAHEAGVQGMWTGAAIGGVAGGLSGYAYAKQNQINPWTGKPLWSSESGKTSIYPYDLSPDPSGENITLYRGITGSENKPGPLFLTDDPNYAASYGSQVVEITISRTTYFQMQNEGVIYTNEGINYSTGQSGTEYMIYRQDIKIQFVIKLTPYNR